MTADLTTLWACVFVRALYDAGVRAVVASPGSRSTPLVLAAASVPGLELEMIVDERSAAFFALGRARVSGRPSVLLCTSGSAGAHYYPAILEAERALLPLIAVTADRPWELGQLHANQALDQTKLFGSHAESLELGEPDEQRLRYVPSIAALAVERATLPVPGPVHVNARFRKPLEPARPVSDVLGESVRLGLEAPRIVRAEPSGVSVPAEIADVVARARRGLVVVGPRLGAIGHDLRLRRALQRFVTARNFALAAEVTSGVAHSSECGALVLPAFDGWIEAACDAGDAPDLIIELGSPPTSSAWQRLTARLPARPRIVVTERALPDPAASASHVVVGNSAQLLETLAAAGPSDAAWLERLTELARRTESLLSEALAGTVLSEPFVASRVVDSVPDGGALFVGNSLPVRDVDRFAASSGRALMVLHQRGLSGIDGLIAGAAGARRELPASVPLTLLLGDVSALHDVGSFALLARVDGPLTLVVVDNGGGRIFSELPVANVIHPAELERLFLTPPPDFLEYTARAFGIAYERIQTRSELEARLAVAPNGARLLHVIVPAEAGRARRRAVVDGVARSLGAPA